MNESLKEIWNYVLSLLLIIIGGLFLVMFMQSAGRAAASGLNERQPIEMLLGAIFLIVAGIIALPIIARRMQRWLAWGLGVLAVGIAAFLLVSLYGTIKEEMDYQAEYAEYNEVTKQRLLDIRTAQEAYADYNGRYTDNWDTLIQFINAPLIPKQFKLGDFIPRRISDEDSLRNGSMEEYAQRGLILKRSDLDSVAAQLNTTSDGLKDMIRKDRVPYRIVDTTYISLYDDVFNQEYRERKGLPLIEVDKIAYNPHPASGEKFIVKVGMLSSGNVGDVKTPVIEVIDRKPFGREGVKKVPLAFGSLEEAKTDGNWARE